MPSSEGTLQFQNKMKPTDLINKALYTELKRGSKLLNQGLHDPTVMETLSTLSASLKLVTKFEKKLLAELDVE
jgi:hypothetical protein